MNCLVDRPDAALAQWATDLVALNLGRGWRWNSRMLPRGLNVRCQLKDLRVATCGRTLGARVAIMVRWCHLRLHLPGRSRTLDGLAVVPGPDGAGNRQVEPLIVLKPEYR